MPIKQLDRMLHDLHIRRQPSCRAISSQCNSYIWKDTKAATAKMIDGMADRPRAVLHYDQFVETDLLHIPLAARVMAPSPIESLCPRHLDSPDKKKPCRKYSPVMVNAVNGKCVREHRGYWW